MVSYFLRRTAFPFLCPLQLLHSSVVSGTFLTSLPTWNKVYYYYPPSSHHHLQIPILLYPVFNLPRWPEKKIDPRPAYCQPSTSWPILGFSTTAAVPAPRFVTFAHGLSTIETDDSAHSCWPISQVAPPLLFHPFSLVPFQHRYWSSRTLHPCH